MKKTTIATRKKRLEEWLKSVIGSPVEISLWPGLYGIRVSEVEVTAYGDEHGVGEAYWTQSDPESIPLIFSVERCLLEWDHKVDRNEHLANIKAFLEKQS